MRTAVRLVRWYVGAPVCLSACPLVRLSAVSRPHGTCQASPQPLASSNASRYYSHVIRSFRDRETARLFERQRARRLPGDIQRVALRKLRQLDAAVDLADLRVPPGNRLERLVGDRAGQFSIRINDQWRICFRWQAGDAYDVAIADYH